MERRGSAGAQAASRVVLMGVSGCGKSTVGALAAARCGAAFVDGDDLHPPGNVAKMAAGQPLDDDDRAPWLDRVGAVLAAAERPLLVACSALRRRYRDRIRAAAGGPVLFVHLDGPRAVLAARLAGRQGHFMPPGLLDSQLATLEALGPDEAGVRVDISPPPEAVSAEVVRHVAAFAG